MRTSARIFALVLIVASFVALPVTAKNYAGTNVPDTIQYAGKKMLLNGVGQRKKLFMKLYVGSLYLQEKSNDATKIVAADEPMAIRLAITSSLITIDKMKEATLEGFNKATGGNISPIRPQIDELLSSFDKGVSTGDVYELINIPGSGVHVVRNGVRVKVIRSAPFKRALFGIWLSKTPVQESLKRKMLGL